MSERQRTEDMVIVKERVSVEICSTRGALSRGDVFLRAPQEGGRGERLLDVLAERWFIPLKTPEKMIFVATRHVAWVRIDLLAAIDELDPAAEDDEASCVARVVVELVDATQEGGHLEGTMRYVAPPSLRRLGDQLERLPQFFALRTDDWVYLVSAAAVASVTPLEEKR